MFGLFKSVKDSFAGNYAAAKVEDFGADLEKYIAGLDPKGVSKAAIRQLDQKVSDYALMTAKARKRFAKEAQDVVTINALFEQRMKAAEIMNGKSEASPENSALATARDNMMKQIEDMQPQIQKENDEEAHYKEMLDMWDTRTKRAASALGTLKESVEKLSQGIEMADAKSEMAKEKMEMSKMKENGGDMGLSSALTAMQSALDEKESEAEAIQMKSDLLTPTSLEDDPIVKAAMAEASGETDVSTLSFSERMAAMKK